MIFKTLADEISKRTNRLERELKTKLQVISTLNHKGEEKEKAKETDNEVKGKVREWEVLKTKKLNVLTTLNAIDGFHEMRIESHLI